MSVGALRVFAASPVAAAVPPDRGPI